ncbi:hypothetical protein AQJ23_28515 [Streptomyces antibioticus]|nr:hypothetical protein AQJ23_28515 [Streptomyces antibioticus]
MARTYRKVIGLTGPLLPVLSFLARLPTATVQFGSVLLVARTSGSLTAAGLTGGALALTRRPRPPWPSWARRPARPYR